MVFGAFVGGAFVVFGAFVVGGALLLVGADSTLVKV